MRWMIGREKLMGGRMVEWWFWDWQTLILYGFLDI